MAGAGCEVHFTPWRQWVRGRDVRKLDLIQGNGDFFVVVKEAGTSDRGQGLEMKTSSVEEERVLARGHAAGLDGRDDDPEGALPRDGDDSVRVRAPTGSATPLSHGARKEDDHATPYLIGSDVSTWRLMSTLMPGEVATAYILESSLHFVGSLGHKAVVHHLDQEPVLITLLNEAQSWRKTHTLLRECRAPTKVKVASRPRRCESGWS